MSCNPKLDKFVDFALFNNDFPISSSDDDLLEEIKKDSKALESIYRITI